MNTAQCDMVQAMKGNPTKAATHLARMLKPTGLRWEVEVAGLLRALTIGAKASASGSSSVSLFAYVPSKSPSPVYGQVVFHLRLGTDEPDAMLVVSSDFQDELNVIGVEQVWLDLSTGLPVESAPTETIAVIDTSDSAPVDAPPSKISTMTVVIAVFTVAAAVLQAWPIFVVLGTIWLYRIWENRVWRWIVVLLGVAIIVWMGS